MFIHIYKYTYIHKYVNMYSGKGEKGKKLLEEILAIKREEDAAVAAAQERRRGSKRLSKDFYLHTYVNMYSGEGGNDEKLCEEILAMKCEEDANMAAVQEQERERGRKRKREMFIQRDVYTYVHTYTYICTAAKEKKAKSSAKRF